MSGDKIAPDTYLFHPEQPSTNAGRANDPDTILLCGFMDAHLKQLQKYVMQYQVIYPAATLLLLQSTSRNLFFRSARANRQVTRAAADFLSSRPPSDKLLVHAMSNGGGMALTHLARSVKALRSDLSPALPAKALIFDSMPGSASFSVFMNAFTIPFRKSNILVRFAAATSVAFAFLLTSIHKFIFRRPGRIEDMKTDLLDPTLFPAQAPRLFMYSKEDNVIPYQSLEEHVARSKQVFGADKIETKVFEGTGHVAHMRSDPDGYFKAIQATWAKGSGNQRS